MRSGFGVLLFCWTASLAAGGQPPPATSAPAGLEGVNPEWLAPTERRIEEQVRLLTAAYELDAAGVAGLREELQRRLVAQVPIERAYQKEKMEWLRKTKREGRKGAAYEEDRRAFFRKMTAELEAMPLDENQVARWVEQRVPPERAAAGRVRLQELWQRRVAQRDQFLNDTGSRSGMKARNVEVHKAETATVTAEGNPLPMGDKQKRLETGGRDRPELDQPVAPNKGLEQPTGPLRASVRVDTTMARAAVKGETEQGEDRAVEQPKTSTPARPLDEWDRQVAEVANKYAFTDGQMARARAMLAELKGRVEQYHEARAEAFAKAGQIADAAAQAEQMRLLDAPIGAMFEELKSRLESLPTAEQRQRAEGAAKPKG